VARRGGRRLRLAQFDENTAAGMCYTSGTTGNPKGVVYSHRSNVLHSFAHASTSVLGISGNDTDPADRAAVSRQRLVARLFGADVRRDPGDARA
jgi:Acyl-CoA synthetases (AMP-forming)/AMP-acid ligases II